MSEEDGYFDIEGVRYYIEKKTVDTRTGIINLKLQGFQTPKIRSVSVEEVWKKTNPLQNKIKKIQSSNKKGLYKLMQH